jgi:hypothetical protein
VWGERPHVRSRGRDMAHPHNLTSNTVGVQVELFGMARLVCGRPLLELDLPCDATLAEMAHALVAACPACRGPRD